MVSSSLGGAKRKMVKIGTHSGSFHCDEALGCFLLRQTDTFKDAEIVRTRDESVLSELDVVIDVGGKYDPGTYRPHHRDDCQLHTGFKILMRAPLRTVECLSSIFVTAQVPSASTTIREASPRYLAMVRPSQHPFHCMSQVCSF